MLIQCTKKLLAELKVETSEPSEEEALLSWHANMITVNRRKTLVVTNDSNRYITVLHGLKAKDLKKIDELILQAIIVSFREEGIKDEVIEAYISQSNKFSFTTTKNRTLVARLNKACENVYYFEERIDQSKIYQAALGKRVSSILVGNGKNTYTNSNEDLYRNLENFIGGPIFQSEAFVLHVRLELKSHEVWRRVIVPKQITFPNLHKTLQIAFGWKDCHLHEFSILAGRPIDLGRKKGKEEPQKPIVNLVCDIEAFDYDNGIPMKLELGEKLLDYLPAEIIYKYDFGDGWEHRILIEKVIDNYELNYPYCVASEGNTPPEDVGGEPRYEDFLKILADTTHTDCVHMTRWGVGQGYKDFDIEMVNRGLKFM
jgi:hypothetical protein